jgi:hypothetical protein
MLCPVVLLEKYYFLHVNACLIPINRKLCPSLYKLNHNHITIPFEAIQRVPGGKVSILEYHSIGHSKQKMYKYMSPIPNCFQDRAISLYSYKIVDKKEILRTVSNTGIYCSNDNVGTVYLV